MGKKALLEATELRDAERAENEETLATAREGLKGVEDAIELLRPFYEQSADALLQKVDPAIVDSVAPKDDKEYRDQAPEIFQDKYRGAQTASKGILGLLDVIASDFERTINTVSGDEQQAESNFKLYKTGIDGLIKVLDGEKTK